MAKDIRPLTFGQVRDILHFDYGYTDDESEEIINNNPKLLGAKDENELSSMLDTIER